MNFLWETAFAIIAMFRFFINLLRLLVQAPRFSESSLHFAFCVVRCALKNRKLKRDQLVGSTFSSYTDM